MSPDGQPLQRNAQKKYSKNEWSLIGEGGFKFMVSEDVSLNLGINMNYVSVDNLDDIDIGTDNDIFFTAFGGVTIYFLGTRDTDNDGISDDDDLCPKTPGGVIVDANGCPVDSDNDGVPDYLDRCPNTPANVPVDTNGCLVDSDEDGVPDYLDLCRDTPVGVKVDKRGCALDEDNDGVPDYKDKCPNTPYGMEVDKFGCPIEVIEIEQPEITKITLTSGVNFEVGSSKLLQGAKPELNKIINVIKKNPGTVWQISGYTDNTGSYDLNLKLSYERASSVADYFIDYGISPSRLQIKGFGPALPIADNSTESGRAMNRRVVIELLHEEDQTWKRQIPVVSSSDYNFEFERQIGNMIFTDGSLYCYQVAAFRKRNQAENEAKRWMEMGVNAFVVEADLPELDGTWYRVRVGYFQSFNEAKENKRKFTK
jgi:OOP family OmpA-OmpF porin